MGLNHIPDHNSDLMNKDFGTVVLITDPKSDYYLKKASESVKKQKKQSNN
jgi:hypothetical protein